MELGDACELLSSRRVRAEGAQAAREHSRKLKNEQEKDSVAASQPEQQQTNVASGSQAALDAPPADFTLTGNMASNSQEQVTPKAKAGSKSKSGPGNKTASKAKAATKSKASAKPKTDGRKSGSSERNGSKAGANGVTAKKDQRKASKGENSMDVGSAAAAGSKAIHDMTYREFWKHQWEELKAHDATVKLADAQPLISQAWKEVKAGKA